MPGMRLVILESPYRGDNYEHLKRNIDYARKCMKDCLMRGEAPFASHLLYTQEGVLDDTIPEERKKGLEAAHAWISRADAMVVYTDFGISDGMKAGIEMAKKEGKPLEYRVLDNFKTKD